MAQTPPERLPGAVEPGRRQPPPLPSASLKLEWTIDLPPGAGPPKALLGEALTLDELVL